MDIELVIIIIWLIVMLIFGIAVNYSKIELIHKNRKLIGNVVLIINVIILIRIIIVRSTDTLYDSIIVIVYFSVMICILGIIEHKSRKSTLLSFIFYSVSYVIIFICITQINKHLLDSIEFLFIILVLMGNIKTVNKRTDREIIIAANIIGIVIVFIMFRIYSESYLGKTKQEHIVKNYILQNQGYKREDIRQITPLTSYPRDSKEKRLFVKINSQSYIYYYKLGEIIQIETINGNE